MNWQRLALSNCDLSFLIILSMDVCGICCIASDEVFCCLSVMHGKNFCVKFVNFSSRCCSQNESLVLRMTMTLLSCNGNLWRAL